MDINAVIENLQREVHHYHSLSEFYKGLNNDGSNYCYRGSEEIYKRKYKQSEQIIEWLKELQGLRCLCNSCFGKKVSYEVLEKAFGLACEKSSCLNCKLCVNEECDGFLNRFQCIKAIEEGYIKKAEELLSNESES